MTQVVLKVEELVHRYNGALTLKGLNLEVRRGEVICLLGSSGCGKTTLLRCIAGFEQIDGGSISIDGELVAGGGFHRPPEKRRVGVVFQDYALFPHLSVYENIAFGIHGLPGKSKAERIQDLLRATDLESLAQRMPHELSGGQQQRVALARALAPQPDLILMDEPFSNLDDELRERLKFELLDLLDRLQVTAVLVTHNQEEAFDMAHSIAIMKDGNILQKASASELYHNPSSRAVAEFLRLGTLLPCTIGEKGLIQSELGDIPRELVKKAHEISGSGVLLLRPGDLILDEAAQVKARLVRVIFRGLYQIYELKLSSGRLVHCLISGEQVSSKVGQWVNIRLTLKELLCFKD